MMTKRYIFFIITLLCFALGAQAQVSQAGLTAKAKDFVQKVEDENYEAARAYMDDKLKLKLHPVALKNEWDEMSKEAGMLKNLGEPKFETKDGSTILKFQADFSRQPMVLQFTFNNTGLMTDFEYSKASVVKVITAQADSAGKPALVDTSGSLPPYAHAEDFVEQPMKLQSNAYTLPGILTLPKKGSKWPVVILIQDQGPLDKDETIGPNKPFRDIALGLAEQGVASFRYDKRTYAYKDQLSASGAPVTPNSETIEDAISAINLMRSLGYIDKKNVYVLGQGIGGYLLPRIGQHAPFLGGLIMINANGLPLEEDLKDREKYLLQIKNDPDSSSKMDQYDAMIHLVRGDSLNESVPADQLPGGFPASYWMDLKNYSAPYTAYDVNLPMFIIHGTRDYEVTNSDYDRWRTVLRRKLHVDYKTYPVNHNMMEGAKTDLARPNEYNMPGHVPSYLITDIAEWVKKSK